MGRRLLEISYLGTAYCGWQVQSNGVTVQFTVQNALEQLLGHRPQLTGCSRTDAGVHANSFFCHFDTNTSIPDIGIVLGLNRFLPYDISALSCKQVADDFHARYQATGKEYIYKLYESRVPDPFLYGRALQIKQPLDLKKAQSFCSLMSGTHDFVSFSSAHRSVKDTVRTVTQCSLEQESRLYTFRVSANGFLYNMVRIMVGTMLEVSQNKRSIDMVAQALQQDNRKLAGYTAPPFGLYLNRVMYSL